MENIETNTASIEEKYNRYMKNAKKANKKYIETHRDMVNEKKRIYYHSRLANNEEYKKKKREYNRQLYQKKKEDLGKSENYII